MDERTVVLEGLPDDLDFVIAKLELYFKNKKRSGAEAVRILEDAQDKRKALLVYQNEGDVQNVLARAHHLDFRHLGVVQLTVKVQEGENVCDKKVKPPVRPRYSQHLPAAASQSVTEVLKENEAESRCQSLLVSSSESMDEDTLILYFEQFSDQFDIQKHEEDNWILNFKNHSDMLKILAVKDHEFGFSVEEYKEGSVSEKLDLRRFILTGFKPICKCKLVSLFITSCSEKAKHTWELLGDGRIVVTFKDDIYINNFFSKCTSRRPQGMDISASQLELTDSVLVQVDMVQVKEDSLRDHFSNRMRSGGGDIKSISWISQQKSVVIVFKDFHAAYRVVEQKHHLCGEDLTVLLFYSSLQLALTGETPTLSGIPTNITVPVDTEVFNFIENSEQCRNDLLSQLQINNVSVTFDKADIPRKLILEMAVDKDSLAALRIGPTWESNARITAQTFFQNYKSVDVAVEVEVWKTVENTCLALRSPEADIIFRKTDSKVVIVGQTEVVHALLDKIKNLVKGTIANLSRDRDPIYPVVHGNSVEKIPLRSVQEMEFIESFLNLSKIPEIMNLGIILTHCCDPHGAPYLMITTTEDKIKDAIVLVQKQLSTIVIEKLTYSKPGESKVLEKNESNVKAKAKEWNCKLYFSQQSKCGSARMFQHKIDSCTTLTIAHGDLHEYTADTLVCPMSTNLAFDNPTALKFLEVGGSKIQEVCNKLQEEKQTLLAGDIILSNPGNLQAKTLIYSVLPKSSQSLGLHYLKSTVFDILQKAEHSDSASVAMPVVGGGIFEFSIQESCTAIREAILDFVCANKGTQRNVKNISVVDSDVTVAEELNILVAKLGFPNATTSTTSPPQVSRQNLDPKPNVDTSVLVRGVQVFLRKGDITKETADVIVNSNNRDLNLQIGVSGAIFTAAGESIVNEYKAHDPRPDNVILTGGGNLSCKHIAHMFGPITAVDITTSFRKVLNLCESKKVATVAAPAFGTGQGGISPYDCIRAFFTGLESHLILNSSSLKEITVLAYDQITWEAFRDYFKERNRESLPRTIATHTNQVEIRGVRIEIKKGDITMENVDIIVNTTNREMDSQKGVSQAILKAAGPSVLKEIRIHGSLERDTTALTSGGKLLCKYVIHMRGPYTTAEARSRVKKVLERCEHLKISTVSFPAVGTGGCGLKCGEVVHAMMQAFEDHISQHLFTVLKHIFVVIDRDDVLKEFQQGFKTWAAQRQESGFRFNGDGDACDEGTSVEENQESIKCAGQLLWDPDKGIDVDSLDPYLEQLFNMCGITKEQLTDKAVSKVIYDFIQKKGGVEAIKEELQNPGSVALALSDTLRVKKQKKKNKRKKLTSEDVGIPQNFRHIAHGLLDVHALDPELKTLFDVCGISEAQLRDKKTVKVIADFIEKRGGLEAVKEEFRRYATSTTQQNQVHLNPAKEPQSMDNDAAGSFPVTTVEVYGTSSADLAKVKNVLDDVIFEECTSRDFQSSDLTNLQEADKEAIISLGKNNQVQIVVASSDKLTLSGTKGDVLDTVLLIGSFIQVVRERYSQEFEKRKLSKTLCWEVADGEAWVPLDSSVSFQLEVAFHKKEIFTYEEGGEVYNVDFEERTRKDSRGKSCRIKRTLIGDAETAIIQPPPTWIKMEGKDLERIPLTPDSEEFVRISTDFLRSIEHHGVNPVQVTLIFRIQNKGLWQSYSVLKQQVDKKYPTQINEQFLYHGTTKEICQKINKNGFNRSFWGRNAVSHGHGTYFAKEAWYSCNDQYSKPDEDGLKHVYRARVVTGKPCKSRKGMKEPDPLDPNDPQAGLHDCAVDDLQNPLIFVVFCDAGAYPDYLITFKNVLT
ncbi:protein mono-ADP-ribosyltransferase PARP14-like [Hoplias malabaricus]|uniref:protein mono-ADP-ribosyltransferase PARP14-like n=1 Tax=Hoplias malabaricus TaxID=27720 RepID=UPI003462D8B1